MKTEQLTEGWVNFTRNYCKEGFIDRHMGDSFSNPNNPAPHPMNGNLILTWFRLNGSGLWLERLDFKPAFYSAIIDLNDLMSADEIWKTHLVINTDELLDQIFDISTTKEGKSLQELTLKCAEEIGELSQAVLSFTGAKGCTYKELKKEDVIEELADVFLVNIAMVAKLNITKEEFKYEISRKLQKWVEKMNK